MKKLFYAFVLVLLTLSPSVFAEAVSLEPNEDSNVRYRLYQTQNMWTFLKLDTMTGKIWQVQFSIEGPEYRFETPLSLIDIPETLGLEQKIGRYALFPTQNFYNFIMLDQIDGHTYQVQWSGELANRYILQISN